MIPIGATTTTTTPQPEGTYFAFGMDHCHSTGSTLVACSTPLLSTSPWTLGSWKGTTIAGIPTCGFSHLRLTIDLDDSHSSKFDFEARPLELLLEKKTTPQVCFRGDSEDRHLLFTRVLLVQKDSETFGSVSPRSLRKRSTLMQRCDLQLQVIWRPLALPCKVYSRIATNLRCGGGYLDLGCLYVLPASNIHLDFKKLYHFRSFGKPVPFL